uniref:winged helix DNA-binding domain-containing protein n=1 Tax=Corynebacterium variabile TaxID=1727 RepID=UPI0028AE97E4
QAQNAAAGREALALRTSADSLSPADLSAAGVVRSWSQRGTHHYLPARDVRWITLLCSPRVQRASAKRRGLLGLTDADVDLGRTALLAALVDGTSLTRTQCYGAFRDAGVDPDGGRGPHMLRHFGGEGDIIQGVPAGREETFVLHDAAVSDPVDLTGEDALGALATRYFRSRGPATVKDFAWWTGLTVTDAKKGTALAVAAGAVIEASAADGRTMYLGDWQVDVTDAELADAVSPEHADIPLPAFDEYLMAYTDRSDIITPDVTAEVGPTKNGLVHPSVLRAGVVTARR